MTYIYENPDGAVITGRIYASDFAANMNRFVRHSPSSQNQYIWLPNAADYQSTANGPTIKAGDYFLVMLAWGASTGTLFVPPGTQILNPSNGGLSYFANVSFNNSTNTQITLNKWTMHKFIYMYDTGAYRTWMKEF